MLLGVTLKVHQCGRVVEQQRHPRGGPLALLRADPGQNPRRLLLPPRPLGGDSKFGDGTRRQERVQRRAVRVEQRPPLAEGPGPVTLGGCRQGTGPQDARLGRAVSLKVKGTPTRLGRRRIRYGPAAQRGQGQGERVEIYLNAGLPQDSGTVAAFLEQRIRLRPPACRQECVRHRRQ